MPGERKTRTPRMATQGEAREALIRFVSQFQRRRGTRVVFMGDGVGGAASNLKDPNKPGNILVRPNLRDSTGYFSVKNKRVSPEFNKPVLLGYLDEEPEEEQVLTINDISLEWTASGIDVINRGQQSPHHASHEFGGADTVFVSSQQFLPGLVQPTNPPSMQVQIQPFVFFHMVWNSYPGGISANLSTYLPTTGYRYILIAFNPESEALEYGVGSEFTTGGFGGLVGGLDNVPEPTGDSYPLGIILLTPTTTTLDWNRYSTSNIRDARLLVNIPTSNIFARIEELENTLGLDHDATTTGAGASSSGDLLTNAGLLRGVNILDVAPVEGQFLKYDINSNSWRPASSPAGSGETNTGENLGSGIGVFREKTGVGLLFKSLSPGNFTTLSSGASEITIATEPRERSFTFTIGASNTWNNELIPIWRGPRSGCATLLAVYPTTSGTGELNFNLQKRSAIATPGIDIFSASQHATSQSNAYTSFASDVIDPIYYLMFTTGSAVESGSVSYLSVTVYYKEYV